MYQKQYTVFISRLGAFRILLMNRTNPSKVETPSMSAIRDSIFGVHLAQR
jgi:hypothetical protein